MRLRTSRLEVGVVAVLLAVGVNTCYGPPKFWRSFVGWKEAEVIHSLGEPNYDSRVHDGDKAGQSFTLGWYHGLGGTHLTLEFDRCGTVVRQSRGIK